MNKKSFKKISIISFSVFALIYLLFLVLPFILSPVLNGYTDQISEMIEKSSNFKVKLDNMQIITTPKLTVGLKINKTEAFLPNNEKFLQADNVQIKLSLLPIMLRKIELDVVSADNVELDLKVEKDGKFLIENYVPAPQKTAAKAKPTKQFFKLSNHLPNITKVFALGN
jgi:uncharacterized protein involved in outer membrane biogenesis